jgi:hypothetical protein
MINQFEAQLFLEGAAFVSILILGCNILVKSLIYLAGGFLKWKDK